MVDIYTFVQSSSNIKEVNSNEFKIINAGAWVTMFCPPEFQEISFTRTKKQGERGDELSVKLKDFRLTPGETKRFENTETTEKDIDIIITMVRYVELVVVTDTDPVTGEIIERTEQVITHPSAGTENIPPIGGRNGDDTKTSNAGFYIFLFIVLALVVLGGYLWYKKKLPGQEDNIISDIKDKVKGDE